MGGMGVTSGRQHAIMPLVSARIPERLHAALADRHELHEVTTPGSTRPRAQGDE